MPDTKPTQFKLADDGRILFQKDPSNPLPGESVAHLKKGSSALAPGIEIIEDGANHDAIAAWLKAHIGETLESLVGLGDTDDLPGPVRGICFQLYEAMGIVPRENLEDLIGGLDAEMRRALRNKQVRLGPILVFLPALNKPAAVRLRGLLWLLWNDKPLPANVPADGMVSLKIDAASADLRFYQAIGYPIYGPRAIRIDMLDRVINAVYENAKEGKFKAEHKMAEWLGSSIDDLYAVLDAMGHKKISEPAAPVAVPAEASAEPKPEVKLEVKPELATFRLKKGKAFEKPVLAKPKNEDRPRAKKGGRKGRSEKSAEPRVISASPRVKTADSPFAILEQLKVKKDASGS